MLKTRTVWKTPKAGSIQNLQQQQEPLVPLPANQVRIETKAIGLNFADIFALTGLYSATPKGAFIPGLEYAGIVSEVGSEVTDISVGDKVMGVTRFGGYASVIDSAPEYCHHLPEAYSHAEGAAYIVQTLTAWYALHGLGDVQPQHNVLVNSAAGGVGLQAMRLCRALGAHALGTVSHLDKKALLREEGFEQVVVRDIGWQEQIKDFLGDEPLHCVLDAIGGKVQKQCYQLLAPTGRLVVFGAADFAPGKSRPRYLSMLAKYFKRPTYDALNLITDNKSVMGFNLIWLWEAHGWLFQMLNEVAALDLPPPLVGKTFTFEQAHEAIEYLRSGQSVGKIVLEV